MTIDISKLEFEERVDSEVYGTTTLYFIGPKELLGDEYPEAESAEIRVEFDTNNLLDSDFYPTTMISPTKDGLDYDWNDLYIDDAAVVRELINIGLRK